MVPGMALSVTEREQFLAEPHIGALSVLESPDRGPLSVPTWYDYEPGGELLILTAVGSRKGKAIEAAGRFTLLAERVEPTVRYVSVEGPVTGIVRGTEEELVRMAHRYLPPDKAEAYLEFARSDHPDQLVVRMRPRHWLSADLGG